MGKNYIPDERRDDRHTTIEHEQFNDAANYTVQNARKDDGSLILTKSKIHGRVYSDLRERTDLPQTSCSRLPESR